MFQASLSPRRYGQRAHSHFHRYFAKVTRPAPSRAADQRERAAQWCRGRRPYVVLASLLQRRTRWRAGESRATTPARSSHARDARHSLGGRLSGAAHRSCHTDTARLYRDIASTRAVCHRTAAETGVSVRWAERGGLGKGGWTDLGLPPSARQACDYGDAAPLRVRRLAGRGGRWQRRRRVRRRQMEGRLAAAIGRWKGENWSAHGCATRTLKRRCGKARPSRCALWWQNRETQPRRRLAAAGLGVPLQAAAARAIKERTHRKEARAARAIVTLRLEGDRWVEADSSPPPRSKSERTRDSGGPIRSALAPEVLEPLAARRQQHLHTSLTTAIVSSPNAGFLPETSDARPYV